jgi:hypothetical protein
MEPGRVRKTTKVGNRDYVQLTFSTNFAVALGGPLKDVPAEGQANGSGAAQ